jgi:benzodiazapine receptor
VKIEWKKLIAAILICQLAGIIGSVFTMPVIGTWYATLNKPFFTPPNWVFGPVWITLYTLIGASLYMIWEKGKGLIRKTAMNAFYAQLGLNTLWSFLFFGLHSPVFGLVCIVALWIKIAYTILKFYKISKNAAYLMVPYLLWVTLATALNASILLLN